MLHRSYRVVLTRLSRLFHPYYFNCYTYNDPLSSSAANDLRPESATPSQMPWLSPGLNSGLSVLALTGSGILTRNTFARILPGLYDTGTATAGADGARVIVHPPNVLPIPLEEGNIIIIITNELIKVTSSQKLLQGH